MELAAIRRIDIEARTSGVDQATAALDKLGRAHDDVSVAAQSTERATLSLERRVESIARKYDLQHRAEQELARTERDLNAARGQGLISLDRQNQLMDLARQRALGLAAANSNVAGSVNALGTSVKASSAQVGGIAAQFQDVAVQLAGGQSPFLIALQQGTQLQGQLAQTGGGVKALGAAFLSLVSPMSLATVGGIAAFGLLVQYVTSAGASVGTLDDRLTRHAEIIKSIRDAYGEAAAGVDNYGKESARVLDVQLRGVTEKLKTDIAAAARQVGALTSIAMPTSDTQFGVPADLVKYTYEATGQYKAFREAVIQLRQGMDDGTVSIGRFRDEVAKVGTATQDANVRKLADELITLTAEAFRAEQALGGSARAIGVLTAQAAAGAPAVAAYGAALRSLQMGVPEMAKALTAQKDLGEASKAFAEGSQAARDAMTAGGMTERAAAASTETYAKRIRELGEAFEARKDQITGATDLTKTFGETLRSTSIAGLEGEAQGIARARDAYDERNRKIADSIKLGTTETQANKLRTESEKILAAELKNVAAANKAKGGSSSSASSGTDSFDSAVQRLKDQTIELRLQQEQASKTGTELYKLEATHRLRRAALQAGRQDEAGLADAIEATATAYATQRKATEDSIEANRRLKESFDAIGGTFKSFAEDILTGTDGISGALKNLGRGVLSSSLDALISGKGALAGITGLAPTDRNSQGGILGALLGLPKAVQIGAEKGSQAGTVDGVVNGLGTFSGGGGSILGSLGIDGKQLAGGLTSIAGGSASASFPIKPKPAPVPEPVREAA
jgi:hypothetical protein